MVTSVRATTSMGRGMHISSFNGGINLGTNVRGSGTQAEIVSHLIRVNWPDHKVSRVDVAWDVSEAGAYAAMRAVALDVASAVKPVPVATKEYADPLAPESGSTLYLGGIKSPLRCRIYQKGYQMQAIGKAVNGFDPNWVRLEFQIKPRTGDKQKFSTLEPADCIGYSKWARELVHRILGLDLEPIKQAKRAMRSVDERVAYMTQTYSRVLMTSGVLAMIYDHGVTKPTNADAISEVLEFMRGILLQIHPEHLPFEVDRKELPADCRGPVARSLQ